MNDSGRGAPGRRRFGALLLSLLAQTACATTSTRTPPAAPTLDSGLDAVPPDLDHVIRVDLARARGALGAPLFGWLEARLFDQAAGDAVQRMVTRALLDSRVMVAGLRVAEDGSTDLVAALEGPFDRFDPRSATTRDAFRGPIDLGGGISRYERVTPGRRGDAALIYVKPPDRVLIATEAEIDAVEAVLERGLAPSTLRPKASGLFSFKSRVARLPERRLLRHSSLSTVLEGATTVEGFVDVRGDELDAELELELESEADARRAAELTETLRRALAGGRGRVAAFAERVSVTSSTRKLVCRATLELARVSSLVGGAE